MAKVRFGRLSGASIVVERDRFDPNVQHVKARGGFVFRMVVPDSIHLSGVPNVVEAAWDTVSNVQNVMERSKYMY